MWLLDFVQRRLLPALVTAMGVVLITAGLLSYADSSTPGTTPEVAAVVETLPPSPSPTPSPMPSPTPSVAPSASGRPSPTATATATPAPTQRPGRAVATRVVIPALKIDLPIIRGNNGYPLCNVAMYLHTGKSESRDAFGQPGEGRATYLYAHARDGMFGPIYQLAIQKRNAKKMLGMVVQVYSSDDKVYLYEIREYRLHALDLEDALGAKDEELWLQTSEGPKGTPGKTQLRAFPISVSDADHADANPKAKPVACG